MKNILFFSPNRVPRSSEAMRMSLHGNVITATLAAELNGMVAFCYRCFFWFAMPDGQGYNLLDFLIIVCWIVGGVGQYYLICEVCDACAGV